MPQTQRRTRTRARVIVPIVLAVTCAATQAIAQVVHVFPGCASTLQACIDAAAPGDVVRIATGDPIEQSASVRRSLTLEAAPGVRPTFRAGSSVFVGPLGDATADITVRGLTLERGQIQVQQGSTGALHVALVDNVIQDSRTFSPRRSTWERSSV
jgi:hypothetical protein